MKTNSKTSLTPNEVLRVVFIHETRGVDEDALAALLSVNPGRVAEAVIALRWACDNHMLIYRHVAKQKKRQKAAVSLPPETAQLINGRGVE